LLRQAAKAEDPACFESMRDQLEDVFAKRRNTKHES
jgi:glutamyl-tRNA reductase